MGEMRICDEKRDEILGDLNEISSVHSRPPSTLSEEDEFEDNRSLVSSSSNRTFARSQSVIKDAEVLVKVSRAVMERLRGEHQPNHEEKEEEEEGGRKNHQHDLERWFKDLEVYPYSILPIVVFTEVVGCESVSNHCLNLLHNFMTAHPTCNLIHHLKSPPISLDLDCLDGIVGNRHHQSTNFYQEDLDQTPSPEPPIFHPHPSSLPKRDYNQQQHTPPPDNEIDSFQTETTPNEFEDPPKNHHHKLPPSREEEDGGNKPPQMINQVIEESRFEVHSTPPIFRASQSKLVTSTSKSRQRREGNNYEEEEQEREEYQDGGMIPKPVPYPTQHQNNNRRSER